MSYSAGNGSPLVSHSRLIGTIDRGMTGLDVFRCLTGRYGCVRPQKVSFYADGHGIMRCGYYSQVSFS